MKKIIYLLILICNFIYAKNVILTSNQLTYTLAKKITDNTNIEVKPIFDAYTDMFNQKVNFKNLENKEEIFKDFDAVITLSKLMKDDFLYEQARKYNIRVVDIDLSYSYDDLSSNVITSKYDNKGNELKYFWLDFSNIYTMIKILENDLSRLYPEEIENLRENSKKLSLEFSKILNEFIDEVFEKSIDNSVIQIGENELDYFLDSIEIFHYNISKNASIKDIEKAVKETGITKFVFNKPISKSLKKYLTEKGYSYQRLQLGNIPVDIDGDENMDVDGYIYFVKKNLNEIKKLLIGVDKK